MQRLRGPGDFFKQEKSRRRKTLIGVYLPDAYVGGPSGLEMLVCNFLPFGYYVLGIATFPLTPKQMKQGDLPVDPRTYSRAR